MADLKPLKKTNKKFELELNPQIRKHDFLFVLKSKTLFFDRNPVVPLNRNVSCCGRFKNKNIFKKSFFL